MRVFALFLIAAVGPSAALADFTGRVVKVSDGDTLTVLVDKTQMRVRLDAIDAPESHGFSTFLTGNMKVAAALGTWAGRYGIKVTFEGRTLRDRPVIWVCFGT